MEQQVQGSAGNRVKNKPLVKELKAFTKPNTTLFSVAFDGGGELPEQLKGTWNSKGLAEKAIKLYKAERQAGTR